MLDFEIFLMINSYNRIIIFHLIFNQFFINKSIYQDNIYNKCKSSDKQKKLIHKKRYGSYERKVDIVVKCVELIADKYKNNFNVKQVICGKYFGNYLEI